MRDEVRRVVVCLGAAALGAGCGSDDADSFRRELSDGFDTSIGVAVDADAKSNFAGALTMFHIPADGLECMVTAGLIDPATAPGDPSTYFWDAAALDALAAQCDVDVSELWYMTD